jgi:hypothetical protein
MIKADFFSSNDFTRIIVIYCTSKVESILVNYQKLKLFLCSKTGYEGIYSQETFQDNIYYKPLLDFRNAFNDILVEEQTINVLLSDGELIVIGCFSLDNHISSEKVKNLANILEKITNTQYSESEINKYNLIIKNKIQENLVNQKKNKGNIKKQDKQRNKIFLALFIFSCFGLVYGFYNLKQILTIQKPEYEIDGLTLSNSSYQNLDTIYQQGLSEKDKCKNANGSPENIINCLKNLEKNVFYYKQNITKIEYEPNSQVMTIDCEIVPNSSINNLTQIKVDNYNNNGYRSIESKILKTVQSEEVNDFQNKLKEYGRCSYILSGIKDAYTEKTNKFVTQNIVPVKLDFYIWFEDDLSILYHEQINNY